MKLRNSRKKSKRQLFIFFLLYFLNLAFSTLFVTKKNLEGYFFLGYSALMLLLLVLLFASNPGYLPVFSGRTELNRTK
jgi:tryptophan-rich sensory protein